MCYQIGAEARECAQRLDGLIREPGFGEITVADQIGDENGIDIIRLALANLDSLAPAVGLDGVDDMDSIALECGKVTYTFVKNRIPVVADDIGASEAREGRNEERNKGGFVMDAQSMDIDNLLSRSQNLARNNRGKDGDR